MKTLSLMGLALLTLAGAAMADDSFVAPKHVLCTIDKVIPTNASFFSFGNPPRVGGTITLDFTSNEITDLTFSKGQIPLKDINAKLVKQIADPTVPDPYYYQYEGTYKSPGENDYVGRLFSSNYETQSLVQLQILQKPAFGAMQIHQLSMTCPRID